MRKQTIEDYGLVVRTEDLESRKLTADQKESGICDVVFGEYKIATELRAVQMVPASLHPGIVDFVCSAGELPSQRTRSNCLMSTKAVEQHLDNT